MIKQRSMHQISRSKSYSKEMFQQSDQLSDYKINQLNK